MNAGTIQEIAESYVNGNISWVKEKVKRMSKIDFFCLVQAIESMTNSNNTDRLIWVLMGE